MNRLRVVVTSLVLLVSACGGGGGGGPAGPEPTPTEEPTPAPTAEPPPPQPLSCDPPAIALAQAPGFVVARTVRCANAGDEAVTIESVTLTGSAALALHFLETPVTVQPGAALPPFTIVFAPEGPGPAATATLVLSRADGAEDVLAVSGDVLAEPPASHATDVFAQEGRALDVLVVLDDSGTMAEEAGVAIASLQAFAAHLVERRAAFHLGVTSAAVSISEYSEDGRLAGTPAVLTPETPDLAQAVFANADLGHWGEETERGLAAAANAVGPELSASTNQGFLREDATLALVFVSDEEDESWEDPSWYATWFRTVKGGGERVTAAAVLGDRPEYCASAVEPGNRYKTLVEDLGGAIASLCDGPFDALLAPLADGVARYAFPLSAAPVPDTMLVRVDGVPLDPSQWRIEAGELVFAEDAVPPAGAGIRADYERE